jgi:DnaJ-class molecular chaperone
MRECPKCRGKGWIPGATFGAPIYGVDMDPCPVCHGTGSVPREEPEPQADTLEELKGER